MFMAFSIKKKLLKITLNYLRIFIYYNDTNLFRSFLLQVSSFLLKNNNNLDSSLIKRIEARITSNIQWIEMNAERIEQVITEYL